jgi:hypothetical protein
MVRTALLDVQGVAQPMRRRGFLGLLLGTAATATGVKAPVVEYARNLGTYDGVDRATDAYWRSQGNVMLTSAETMRKYRHLLDADPR